MPSFNVRKKATKGCFETIKEYNINWLSLKKKDAEWDKKKDLRRRTNEVNDTKDKIEEKIKIGFASNKKKRSKGMEILFVVPCFLAKLFAKRYKIHIYYKKKEKTFTANETRKRSRKQCKNGNFRHIVFKLDDENVSNYIRKKPTTIYKSQTKGSERKIGINSAVPLTEC